MTEPLYYKLGKGFNYLGRKWADLLSQKERNWSESKKKIALFLFIASMLFLLWGSVVLNWNKKKSPASNIGSIHPPASIKRIEQYNKMQHLDYVIDSLKRNHNWDSVKGSRRSEVNGKIKRRE